MVVLPYTSASQSGIPMTVFPFYKPIIASNIDGFQEVIDHFQTGLLVDKLDGQSFANAIETLLLEENLRNKIKENIKSKYNEGEYSWSSIAEKTLSIYQKKFERNLG